MASQFIPLANTITEDRDAKPIELTDSPTAGQPARQKRGGGKLTASLDLSNGKQEKSQAALAGDTL